MIVSVARLCVRASYISSEQRTFAQLLTPLMGDGDGEKRRFFFFCRQTKVAVIEQKAPTVHELWEKRQAEQTVRDRSTERGFRAGFVYPLMVHRALGEGVHAVLVHRDPTTRTELGADHGFPRLG